MQVTTMVVSFIFSWQKDQRFVIMKTITDPRRDPRESDIAARGAHAQNILKRGTGRLKGRGAIYSPWKMDVSLRYSHLVLLDYLTDRQPEPIMASPFDKNLIEWQENPLGYLEEESNVPYGMGMPKEAGYDTDPM